jgi:hypothetical protein
MGVNGDNDGNADEPTKLEKADVGEMIVIIKAAMAMIPLPIRCVGTKRVEAAMMYYSEYRTTQ